MNKKIIFTICFTIFLFFFGCSSWFSKKPEKNAQELADNGIKYFNDSKYQESIDSFSKLKDWYPFSKYAILAELKIADARFNIKEYEEAYAAYEEFENLHPLNEAIPYVMFQRGLCYYNRVDDIDRDQTPTQKALDIFNQLINNFPNNEYSKKAEANIKSCIDTLAESEYYIGNFYYKSQHYRAALSRFKSVLSNYPKSKISEKTSESIKLCEKKLNI